MVRRLQFFNQHGQKCSQCWLSVCLFNLFFFVLDQSVNFEHNKTSKGFEMLEDTDKRKSMATENTFSPKHHMVFLSQNFPVHLQPPFSHFKIAIKSHKAPQKIKTTFNTTSVFLWNRYGNLLLQFVIFSLKVSLDLKKKKRKRKDFKSNSVILFCHMCSLSQFFNHSRCLITRHEHTIFI